jgi:hypothetical protein
MGRNRIAVVDNILKNQTARMWRVKHGHKETPREGVHVEKLGQQS